MMGLRILLLALLATSVSACSSKETSACVDDESCGPGLACINEACRIPCNDAAGCPAGQFCSQGVCEECTAATVTECSAGGDQDGDPGLGQVFQSRIVASSDDIRIRDTVPDITVLEVNAGSGGSASRRFSGMRYQNVTIPQGATILSASVTFRSIEAHSGTDTHTEFSGQATDDPLPFTDVLADYQSRPRTGIAIEWANMPPWEVNETWESPDLAPVIQEIIDRPGWQSGNALVLFWEDSTSGPGEQQRVAYSYDGSPPQSPLLVVRFE